MKSFWEGFWDNPRIASPSNRKFQKYGKQIQVEQKVQVRNFRSLGIPRDVVLFSESLKKCRPIHHGQLFPMENATFL